MTQTSKGTAFEENFDEFLQYAMKDYREQIYSGMISTTKKGFFTNSQFETISSQTQFSSIPKDNSLPNDINVLLSNITIHKTKKDLNDGKQKTILSPLRSNQQNKPKHDEDSSESEDLIIEIDPEIKLDEEINEYSNIQNEIKHVKQQIKINILNKESKEELKKLRERRASLVDEQMKMEANILNTSSILYSPTYKDSFDIREVLNYKKIEKDVKMILNMKLNQDLLLPIHREVIEKTQNGKNTVFCIGASKENFEISVISLGFIQKPSITIVISTDKYMIHSQIKTIEKAGGDAFFFKNTSKPRDLFDINFKPDSAHFLFMSPSFITQEIVLKYLKKKHNNKILRFVIDDPFMVSSISPSYKIEYTLLPFILERFPDKQFLFQSTVISDNILNDILQKFKIKQYAMIRDFIDFPDLFHIVRNIQNQKDMNEELCKWIRINLLNNSKGIVFCQNEKDLLSLDNYMKSINKEHYLLYKNQIVDEKSTHLKKWILSNSGVLLVYKRHFRLPPSDDIKFVVFNSPPHSFDDYINLSCYAGKDNNSGFSAIFFNPNLHKVEDKELNEYLSNMSICRKELIAKYGHAKANPVCSRMCDNCMRKIFSQKTVEEIAYEHHKENIYELIKGIEDKRGNTLPFPTLQYIYDIYKGNRENKSIQQNTDNLLPQFGIGKAIDSKQYIKKILDQLVREAVIQVVSTQDESNNVISYYQIRGSQLIVLPKIRKEKKRSMICRI